MFKKKKKLGPITSIFALTDVIFFIWYYTNQCNFFISLLNYIIYI